MVGLEESNWRQIADLNQRGGPCLSLVDLIEAGTVPLDCAAAAAFAVSRGSSLLTAAREGGTGKTTLMAALLMFMPPGEQLVTVSGPRVIRDLKGGSDGRGTRVLAHEIGSGSWFGYIWGSTVREYFSLLARGFRIATCLHADTLDEMRGTLASEPLCVPRASISEVGLAMFMRAFRAPSGIRRRVTSAYVARGACPETLCTYRPDVDTHDVATLGQVAAALEGVTGLDARENEAGIGAMRAFLDRMRRDGLREIRAVRNAYLAWSV